jgi:riboflavin synthase
MFTGLIEKIGRLSRVERRGDGYRFEVGHDEWSTPLSAGESVAVNGACLTVTRAAAGYFSADVLAETVERTCLLERQGCEVNLERAVAAGGRFGGHFVTGHVDGAGRLRSVAQRGADHVVTVGCPESMLAEVAVKGSVACDGVSLTVAQVGRDDFTVHLVPFTWEHTALRHLPLGAPVNIETDIIAKYVIRAIPGPGAAGGLTVGRLRESGILFDSGTE